MSCAYCDFILDSSSEWKRGDFFFVGDSPEKKIEHLLLMLLMMLLLLLMLCIFSSAVNHHKHFAAFPHALLLWNIHSANSLSLTLSGSLISLSHSLSVSLFLYLSLASWVSSTIFISCYLQPLSLPPYYSAYYASLRPVTLQSVFCFIFMSLSFHFLIIALHGTVVTWSNVEQFVDGKAKAFPI